MPTARPGGGGEALITAGQLRWWWRAAALRLLSTWRCWWVSLIGQLGEAVVLPVAACRAGRLVAIVARRRCWRLAVTDSAPQQPSDARATTSHPSPRAPGITEFTAEGGRAPACGGAGRRAGAALRRWPGGRAASGSGLPRRGARLPLRASWGASARADRWSTPGRAPGLQRPSAASSRAVRCGNSEKICPRSARSSGGRRLVALHLRPGSAPERLVL